MNHPPLHDTLLLLILLALSMIILQSIQRQPYPTFEAESFSYIYQSLPSTLVLCCLYFFLVQVYIQQKVYL